MLGLVCWRSLRSEVELSTIKETRQSASSDKVVSFQCNEVLSDTFISTLQVLSSGHFVIGPGEAWVVITFIS